MRNILRRRLTCSATTRKRAKFRLCCSSLLSRLLWRGFLIGIQLRFVQFGNALIPFICQAQLLWQHGNSVQLEQSEIMNSPFTKGSTDNLSINLVNYYLSFQSMLLILATVISSLVFFGRSIGLSVTSTTTTFQVEAF